MIAKRVRAWAVVVFVAGCGGGAAGPSDAGRVDPRAAVCASVDAGAAPTFDVMQTIFTEDCVGCHAVGAELDLRSGLAWGDLVNHAAPPDEACGGVLVAPGDPSASYLFQKLTTDAPCAGHRMPWDELGARPLPACVIALVRAWIATGAPGPAGDGGAQ